jgi:hypothetical protein
MLNRKIHDREALVFTDLPPERGATQPNARGLNVSASDQSRFKLHALPQAN